jgi:hypothetical protein
MAKSKFSAEEQNEIKRIMKEEHVTRKTAVRHLFPKKAAVGQAKDFKSAAANDKTETKSQTKAPKVEAVKLTPEQVSANRKEGLRLFTLAGRPTKAQFIKVYGKRGHLMTWDQRTEAGVPASKFQAALAEKQGK